MAISFFSFPSSNDPLFFLKAHAEPALPKVEPKPRLCSTASTVSECDSGSSLGSPQAYFSQKARLSFRHQMDSNFNAVDATY